MSRTYRDIRKYKTRKFWDVYWDYDDRLNLIPFRRQKDNYFKVFVYENKEYKGNWNLLYTDYSSAPSWFTRMFTNVPKRREEKRLEQKAQMLGIESDQLIWPIFKKPFTYYF